MSDSDTIWSPPIDKILSVGVSLGGVGVRNYGLVRREALRALDLLRASQVPVLGGDVYRVVDGAPKATYDNWFCDRKPGETDEAFLERCHAKGIEFVGSYQGEGTLFALVPQV